jgi:hypothetical protein
MNNKTVVSGWDSLDKQLARLANPKEMRKVARSAANFAVNPALKSARAEAPIGKIAHKTYKGRLVAPGFAARNIRKRVIAGKAGGNFLVRAMIGTSGEAFYATFYDKGFKRKGGRIEPGTGWLSNAIPKNKAVILKRFSDRIRHNINKIAGRK